MKILITGASKGIGRAIAERTAGEGWDTIGTSREPAGVPAEERFPNVTYLPLDLTKPKSIDSLVNEVGEVDAIVNNAGLAQIGPVEEVEMDNVRYLFDLNLVGAIHLTRGFLSGMRKKGRGVIVNITSMADAIAVPFSTIYAATKHGMLGFTRGLRNEMRPFGVKVISVAPIFIRTGISQLPDLNDDSPYREMTYRVKDSRDASMERGVEAGVVGDLIVKILKAKNPRPLYSIGANAGMLAFLAKILPERVRDAIIRNKYGL